MIGLGPFGQSNKSGRRFFSPISAKGLYVGIPRPRFFLGRERLGIFVCCLSKASSGPYWACWAGGIHSFSGTFQFGPLGLDLGLGASQLDLHRRGGGIRCLVGRFSDRTGQYRFWQASISGACPLVPPPAGCRLLPPFVIGLSLGDPITVCTNPCSDLLGAAPLGKLPSFRQSRCLDLFIGMVSQPRRRGAAPHGSIPQ